MDSDNLFKFGKKLSEAYLPQKTIRDELLDVLASNGSVVVSGCNDETWAASDQLMETGLARGEAEERGLLLVVTLKGLKEAEGIRR